MKLTIDFKNKTIKAKNCSVKELYDRVSKMGVHVEDFTIVSDLPFYYYPIGTSTEPIWYDRNQVYCDENSKKC
jgi:hypothetical protein